jgi:hypothetical protein
LTVNTSDIGVPAPLEIEMAVSGNGSHKINFVESWHHPLPTAKISAERRYRDTTAVARNGALRIRPRCQNCGKICRRIIKTISWGDHTGASLGDDFQGASARGRGFAIGRVQVREGVGVGASKVSNVVRSVACRPDSRGHHEGRLAVAAPDISGILRIGRGIAIRNLFS